MIKITVELWPGGSELNKQVLATGKIWNDGRGSATLGTYGYRFYGKDGREIVDPGILKNYYRSKYSVWWLIAGALKSAFPDVEKAFKKEKDER